MSSAVRLGATKLLLSQTGKEKSKTAHLKFSEACGGMHAWVSDQQTSPFRETEKLTSLISVGEGSWYLVLLTLKNYMYLLTYKESVSHNIRRRELPFKNRNGHPGSK